MMMIHIKVTKPSLHHVEMVSTGQPALAPHSAQAPS